MQDNGLRGRKKQQTEMALAEAALDLFQQHGYSNTTVADIARAVNVSPRTFFRYFATKEDVAFPGAQEQLERLRSELASRCWEPPFARACNAISGALGLVEDDRAVFLRRYELILSVPALHERHLARRSEWENIVADNLITGGVDELRSRLIASATVTAGAAALRIWATTNQQSLHDIEQRAFSILGEGLAHLDAQPEDGPTPQTLATGD